MSVCWGNAVVQSQSRQARLRRQCVRLLLVTSAVTFPAFTRHGIVNHTRPRLRVVTLTTATLFWLAHRKWRLTRCNEWWMLHHVWSVVRGSLTEACPISCTPSYTGLMCQRVMYKLGIMVYNCVHGQATQYLTDVCRPASNIVSRRSTIVTGVAHLPGGLSLWLAHVCESEWVSKSIYTQRIKSKKSH